MRVFVAGIVVLLLLAVPVAAGRSAVSFAVEVAAGTLVAAVPFYAVLFSLSGSLQPSWVPRVPQPSTGDLLLGLVAPPLMAGATVALVGKMFGATDRLAGLAAMLGASVGEVFALRAWELNLPEWMKVIAVPVITSLGATLAFNRQAKSVP